MKKIMKKALLLSIGLAFLVGCSTDSDTSSEIDSLDLTKIINPDTARAAAEFDNTTNGIYKGVFVSDDTSYHGVLTINLGNDSQYNAILEYGDNQNQRMGFVRVNNGPTSISNVIEFRGKNAGFTLDVSDYTQPIFTGGYVDGQAAQAKLLKETSVNQVRAALGTFIDNGDPLFNGTWDLLGSSIRELAFPSPIPGDPDIIIPVINISLVVVSKNGTMFFDGTQEDFEPGPVCFGLIPTLPPGMQAPFFSGPQNVPFLGDINEYAAGDQTSTFLSELATWNLIYSKITDRYYDTDCNVELAGTWSWKGRIGSISIN